MSLSVSLQENEPLLESQGSTPAPASKSILPGYQGIWPKFTTSEDKFRWVPVIGCLIILTNDAEWWTKQVSFMRMLEALHCIEYYAMRDSSIAALGKRIPESLCKYEIIQKQLATTGGRIMSIRTISAMCGALLLGSVADRYGRRPVLLSYAVNVFLFVGSQLLICMLAVLSMLVRLELNKPDVLYPRIPIWALYITGITGLGGNFDLAMAVLLASYTDIVPSTKERSTLFFLTTSMQYIAQAIFPALGSVLMNLDGKGGTPHIAFITSLGFTFLTLCITFFAFPETMTWERDLMCQVGGITTHSVMEDTPHDNRRSGSKQESSTNYTLRRSWISLQNFFSGIGLGSMALLVVSILSVSVGIKSIDWFGIVQYPVVKLGWTFSQASSAISVQASVMLANFSLLLPLYTKICTLYVRFVDSNLLIMSVSCLVLMAGSIVIGFSNSTVIFFLGTILYTLGEGVPVATQAYVASRIGKSRTARVMAMLSIATIIGKITASWLFPKLLAAGLDSHIDKLIGLPFFVSAALFVFAGVCVFVVGAQQYTEMRDELQNMYQDDSTDSGV